MKKTCILNAIERKGKKVVNIDGLRIKINDIIKSGLSSYSLDMQKKIILYVEANVFNKLFEKSLLEIETNELINIIQNVLNELETKDFDEVYCKDLVDVLWDIFESLISEEWDITDEMMSYSEEISYAIDYMQNYYAGEVGYDDEGYSDYSVSSLKIAIDDLYRFFIEQNIKKNQK